MPACRMDLNAERTEGLIWRDDLCVVRFARWSALTSTRCWILNAEAAEIAEDAEGEFLER